MKAGAILQTAPVLVRPLIAVRRQERAQQVAVGAMQVDHVQSRFLDPPGRVGELPDHVLNVLVSHFARRGNGLKLFAPEHGWADGLALRHVGRGLPPSHVNLKARLGALGMHCLGKTSEPGNHVVAVAAQLIKMPHAPRIYVRRLDHKQARSTAGSLGQVVNIARGEAPITICQVLLHGPGDDAIPERHGIDISFPQ